MFKKIAYNTSINFFARAISTLLGLITVALMTRYLGKSGYGEYTIVLTFVHFFGILADFGLTLVTAQMLARSKGLARHNAQNLNGLVKSEADQNKIISNIFTLRFFSSLIFLGLAPLVVIFFPYDPMIKFGVLIMTFSFFCISLNQIFIGFYQQKLLMGRASVSEVASRIIMIAAVWAAVYYNTGLTGIIVATVATSLSQLLINYLLSLKLIALRFAFDKNIWREIIKLSWPMAVTITLNLIYLKTDTIVLSIVRPQAEVGLYGAAYRVIDVLITLPFILSGIVMPQLTAAWFSKDKEKFKQFIQYSFDVLSVIALPLIAGAQFVGKPLMVFVAGPEFAESGRILQLLIIACGAIYFGSIFSHVIVAIEKQRQIIWAYVFTSITAFIGYIIFIPRYSYFGAAGMTIYSEVLITVLIFITYYKYIRFIPKLKTFLKSLLACLIMSLFLYFTRNINVMASILLAVLIYSAVLYPMVGKKIYAKIKS
ncbi:hypothetical protein COT99_02555 [Candidatus Falkowbacteria bacterium CG10_big_fil_rev_8_21_14_0_10_43_10]|uniref:Uncharacterized protein n=1 Tax=Candidatus Falkowbacteria bacterium CG10_big_fil_rev_8_21_14_0_10_43_10 TaxID=1974567 RepID=A0A2H0V1Z1_9BACT|nr:MAG: hypothetical protein COT99_02555 [Candidatus Falkowbacteria bacterium CG10_big_fil_rev_8_21_14_0_10_43_10]